MPSESRELNYYPESEMELFKDIKILTLAALLALTTSCAQKDYAAFTANEEYLIFSLNQEDAKILSQKSGLTEAAFSQMLCSTEISINGEISSNKVNLYIGNPNDNSFINIGAIETLNVNGVPSRTDFTLNGRRIPIDQKTGAIVEYIDSSCSGEFSAEA